MKLYIEIGKECTMGKNQFIVKHDNGWAVKSSGSKRATRVTTTQAEAIRPGIEIAKN